jgi:hypothetical protein
MRLSPQCVQRFRPFGRVASAGRNEVWTLTVTVTVYFDIQCFFVFYHSSPELTIHLTSLDFVIYYTPVMYMEVWVCQFMSTVAPSVARDLSSSCVPPQGSPFPYAPGAGAPKCISRSRSLASVGQPGTARLALPLAALAPSEGQVIRRP